MPDLNDLHEIEWKKLISAWRSVTPIISITIFLTWFISYNHYDGVVEKQKATIENLEVQLKNNNIAISPWDYPQLSEEETSNIRHKLMRLPPQKISLIPEEHSKALVDSFADLLGPKDLNWEIRFDRLIDGYTSGIIISAPERNDIVNAIIDAIEDGTKGRLKVRFDDSYKATQIQIYFGSRPH